jgi:hypothetical protein
MSKINQTELFLYEVACDGLAKYFVERYFGKDAEYYWVAGHLGGTIEVADRFFDISEIAEFIRNKYSSKMMFQYYDKKLDADMKGTEWKHNIFSYKRIKKCNVKK